MVEIQYSVIETLSDEFLEPTFERPAALAFG
jgi:hypothetical protein